jgi:hypothetical protein
MLYAGAIGHAPEQRPLARRARQLQRLGGLVLGHALVEGGDLGLAFEPPQSARPIATRA